MDALLAAAQQQQLWEQWGQPDWAAEETAEQERILQEIAKSHPNLARELAAKRHGRQTIHQKQSAHAPTRKRKAGSKPDETK